MELDLHRVDYLQVAVTGRKCMKVLPNPDKSKRALQKVIVADKSGVITCFGIKKKEVMTVFKTLPGDPVNYIELGGALGTPQDKVFIVTGSTVSGYTRKGKKFLSYDTNLTENISCIAVSGSDLLVAGTYIYNHFLDCQDKGYYLCSDKINDILCLPLKRKEGEEFRAILACDDRTIRVLKATEFLYEIPVSGVPQCITPYQGNGGDEGNELVYGTRDGFIGCVKIGSHEPEHLWEIPNDRNLGGISCLSHHDMTGDKFNDLLVGREDGTIEVYSYDSTDPTLRFSQTVSESITSIHGGIVGTTGFDEIITSTYSGWLIGHTSEQPLKQVGSDQTVNQKGSANTQEDIEIEKKLKALRMETEELQARVAEERNKHHNKTQQSIAKGSPVPLTRASTFHVNDRFVLSPADASYNLSIEVQTPIDHIILQSDVPIDVLDVEKNTSVVSYTSCNSSTPATAIGQGDVNSGNFLLATYRFQSSTNRLELKVRSIEGQYGVLRAYITPQLQPKTCIMKEFIVKPLSLHERTHLIKDDRPMNTLKLTGPFSLAEIHSWVTYSLPGVPERTPTEDVVTFNFINTFLDTVLKCTYKKGEGLFHSDNISTISILKDVLTKEATAKKIALNITYEVNPASIPHTLNLIHPKLEFQLMLAKKVQLIDALQELQVDEGNVDFLAEEYRMILSKTDTLKEEFKKQPAHLERLYGMVTDLFIDKFKFKGVNVKQKVPQLLETLDNYELSTLIEYFENASV